VRKLAQGSQAKARPDYSFRDANTYRSSIPRSACASSHKDRRREPGPVTAFGMPIATAQASRGGRAQTRRRKPGLITALGMPITTAQASRGARAQARRRKPGLDITFKPDVSPKRLLEGGSQFAGSRLRTLCELAHALHWVISTVSWKHLG